MKLDLAFVLWTLGVAVVIGVAFSATFAQPPAPGLALLFVVVALALVGSVRGLNTFLAKKRQSTAPGAQKSAGEGKGS
jgi:membrane protein implicated in regulation of membrane protease activity